MHSLLRYSAAALFAAAVSAGPAFADVVFTDSTFNLANYSPSPTFTTSSAISIGYSSASNTLQFVTTFNNTSTPTEAAQALINTGFGYDPLTQGAITSIDASVMKNLTIDYLFTGSAATNTFHPTILQDGIYYLASIPGPSLAAGPGSTGFNAIAQSGLKATDFLSFDFATGTFGTANPNFDGDTMDFGLTQISSITSFSSDTPGHLTTQYQNMDLDIHSVPEPSTIALFGATLLGLGWLHRRKTV